MDNSDGRETTYSEREPLRIAVGRVLLVQHIIQGGYFSIRVRNLQAQHYFVIFP